ncbi:MAG: hypothetical protein RIQ54_448 [Candidatus Parcubacteria bacterium]|jgi:radical SAM superfamily enzyme YgiQ (UPF0313 family)
MSIQHVLMVYPKPSPSSPQKNLALSIFYPGCAALRAGYHVSFWDGRLDSWQKLETTIAEADVVAISAMSGFQLGEAIEIAKYSKKHYPEKPIIWGGVHVTFQPVQSLRESFVDYVVIGEGERRFVHLLNALRTGTGFSAVDGIGYKRTSAGLITNGVEFTNTTTTYGLVVIPKGQTIRMEFHDADGSYDDGTIYVHRRGLVLDLKEEYVSLIHESVRPYVLAAAQRNELILQVSRGCQWQVGHCDFCSVNGQRTQFDAKTNRIRAVYTYIPFEIWEKELQWMHNIHPFTFIELEDENSSWFLRDKRYAYLLKKLGITYHLHLRSDQLTDDATIAWLAETGCVRIHIGAESGNDETLARMHKGEKVEDHYTAARMLAKHGIQGVYTWIIANPEETPAQIMDTLRVSDEIRSLHPPGMSRATVYVLMPLPGTKSFQNAIDNKWLLPDTMAGWTKMSAAYNPELEPWMNNLYFIAGFHHNKRHKTPQNFPGWWRLLILPLEFIMEARWSLGIAYKNEKFFQCFNFEYWLITKLLKWRSPYAVGQTDEAQIPKLLERLMPGLAGH